MTSNAATKVKVRISANVMPHTPPRDPGRYRPRPVGRQAVRIDVAATVFGTATDITLSELTIETFFPLDAETGENLRKIAASR
jgi:hypothetical protein